MADYDVVVVGGGIIGLSTAYCLARSGRSVLLVEKGDIGAGSSYGNAGLIAPSDSIPLPSPAAISQGIRWLLDPESPLYIKPRLNIDLIRWLWQFLKSSNRASFLRSIPILRDLSRESLRLYQKWMEEEGINVPFAQAGLLLVYRTSAGFQDGQALAETLNRFDLRSQVLSKQDVRERIPLLRPEIVGGVYYLEDAHFDPAAFMRAFAPKVEARGVHMLTHTEVLNFRVEAGKVTHVLTTRGDFSAQHVVLAAGAWTPRLTRRLGYRLPVEAAKGYSITIRRPPTFPEVPVILDEAKVAVTPMGDTLRFAGTLELAGLNMSINMRRVNAIKRGVSEYLTIRPDEEPLVELWRGLRPCSPTGLPYIEPLPHVPNVIVATGHCMLGISQGPATGCRVAQMITGEQQH